MTTIVAVRDGEQTWIGSDTQSTDSGVASFTGSKWARFGSWAVGVSGSLRTVNLCQRNAKRLFDDLSDPLEFTERLRAMLGEYAYDISAEKGDGPQLDHHLILASPHNIWSICSGLSVAGNERFLADGSGGYFASGALEALARFKTMKGEDMARIALEVAMQYDTATGGEIWMDSLNA